MRATPNPLKIHPQYAQNWLRSVTGTASNDVWAVGETRDTDFPGGLDDTLTLHWDGAKWNVVHSPDPGGSGNYNSFWAAVAVSSDEVWAVGDVGLDRLDPMAEHWNGSRWGIVRTQPAIVDGTFLGAASDKDGNIWAVGEHAIKPYTLGTLTEVCQRSPR